MKLLESVCRLNSPLPDKKTPEDVRLVGAVGPNPRVPPLELSNFVLVVFKLNVCDFTTNTIGTVSLVNDELPTRLLPKTNPISTTSGSTTITIHCPNHGMHSTSANVTISGLASGTYNGIASTNINGTNAFTCSFCR